MKKLYNSAMYWAGKVRGAMRDQRHQLTTKDLESILRKLKALEKSIRQGDQHGK